jgi:gamma-glutamylcyclotransferase (GGCT)/AIG2-like uncharacterized protein YtfP
MNLDSKVFVYGTLRQGEYNHHYLREARPHSLNCWTFGKLYDTGVGYPAMVEDHKRRVVGELYMVTKEHLCALDELEDYREGRGDNLYERVVKTVYTEEGREEAYVYLFPLHKIENEIEITSGDWKEYRQENEKKEKKGKPY